MAFSLVRWPRYKRINLSLRYIYRVTQKRQGYIPYVIARLFPRLIAPLRSPDHDISNIAVFPTGLPDWQVSTNDSIKFLVGGWLHSIDSSMRREWTAVVLSLLFVTCRWLRCRLANDRKKRRAIALVSLLFQFLSGQNRTVLTDPVDSYWILKTPLPLNRFRNGPSNGLTPFLFLILCYRWLHCCFEFNDFYVQWSMVKRSVILSL